MQVLKMPLRQALEIWKLTYSDRATPADRSRPTLHTAPPNQSEPYRTASLSSEAILPNRSEPNRTKPNPFGPKTAPLPFPNLPGRRSMILSEPGPSASSVQLRPKGWILVFFWCLVFGSWCLSFGVCSLLFLSLFALSFWTGQLLSSRFGCLTGTVPGVSGQF
jgi:hypothetical protein